MRLKQIELNGFKSFPDKTILDIENGVTAVVGPNGSGKSNISDAIRWVLGELSAKSVRGTKMEDVIFSGSDKRKPLPFAEVSLTIDNSSNPESGRVDSDFDELTVTRRVYRSGDSDYMINRKSVRLRDIQELFMNTGVGKTGYSIIGQGKIAEILSQKSEERRVIFEEAAGISKYRFKKNEAQRKLDGVDENLIRIGDIFSELESRLGPLEKEAEKAKKYLELYSQKKETDVRIWLSDLKKVKSKEETLDAEYSSAKLKYELAQQTLDSLEAQSDKLFAQSQEQRLVSERLNEKLQSNREKLSELEKQSAIKANDISNTEHRISELDTDILLNDELIKQGEENCTKLENEMAVLNGQKSALDERIQSQKADLDGKKSLREQIEKQQQSLSFVIENIKGQITDIKVRAAADDSLEKSNTERADSIKEQLEGIADSDKIIKSRAEKAEKSIADYDAKAEEVNAGLTEYNEKLSEIKSRMAACDKAANDITMERLSRVQRHDALKRMDELFDGYSHSVKTVMKASESGQISGIYGPVSRLISVKSKYAAAVETAAGASIQNIVVADEQCAKNAISYLRNSNGGRATFLPLTSIHASTLAISESVLSQYSGYIGIASNLVQCDEKFRPAVDFLLARTVVFDTLDNASVFARANGYKTRAVTLDSQQINVGGSYTGGSFKSDSGVLTRSGEIDRLDGEIAKLDIKLDAQKKIKSELEKTLAELEKNNSGNEDKLSVIARMKQAEQTQLAVLKNQLDGNSERRISLEKQLNELTIQSAEQEKNREKLTEQLELLLRSLADNEKDYQSIEVQRSELAKVIIKLDSAYNSLVIDGINKNKDIEVCRASLDVAHSSLESANSKCEKQKQQRQSYLDAIVAIKNECTAFESEKSVIAAENDELMRQLTDNNSSNSEKEEQLAKLKVSIKEQTNIRESCFMTYSSLENKLSSVKNESERLTTKLWDEYELTFSTAEELNYPPVEDEKRSELISLQNSLRSRIHALGNVNVSAVDEYKEVSERHSFLSGQIDDLKKSKTELVNIIASLEREMCQRFVETIESLNISFNNVFRELFGGGKAELKLTDDTNVLESGIEINVAPPGKVIKSLSLLSGGEQSFVAIALLYAILNINPTPFCVLDEIEAALDDVNVARFAEYAKRYADKTQFIIITHRRGTMERADRIYGVTMPERGISKVLTLDIGSIEEKLGVKL